MRIFRMMKRVPTRKEEKKAAAPEEVVYTAEIIQEKAASEEESSTAAETKDGDSSVKEKKEERVYLNPLTGWTWPRAPPADPPLRTKDGRVPKVALVVLILLSPRASELEIILTRLRYLETLFEGCEVERLCRHQNFSRSFSLSSDKKGWQQEYDRWKHFFYTEDDFEDVYAYVMSHRYDFALFLTVMENGTEAGVNYGNAEVQNVRHTLRACMLSTSGNAMFGDWGVPSDYPRKHITEEMDDISLASFFDLPVYCDWQNARKTFAFAKDRPAKKRPFARMIRLGRYIRPVDINEEVLPEKVVKKIHDAVRGEAFTRANIWAAWWAAKNGLFFPYDLIYNGLYKWKRLTMIQFIQRKVAELYEKYCEWYYNSWEEEQMRVILMIGDGLILSMSVLLLVYVLPLIWTGLWEWWMLKRENNVIESGNEL
jgi:hypothetical protein